mmetsp:Transcript_46955/g.111843  ORF Transcript_46955/g.111843 Transcript_46955/m.111843 type:complete len:495 (+) Transcript_46955:169-1653(+)
MPRALWWSDESLKCLDCLGGLRPRGSLGGTVRVVLGQDGRRSRHHGEGEEGVWLEGERQRQLPVFHRVGANERRDAQLPEQQPLALLRARGGRSHSRHRCRHRLPLRLRSLERERRLEVPAVRESDPHRSDRNRGVAQQRQPSLKCDKPGEVRRVVEEVVRARCHAASVQRQHAPRKALPRLVLARLSVVPHQPHREDPLKDGGEVDGPSRERESVLRLRVQEGNRSHRVRGEVSDACEEGHVRFEPECRNAGRRGGSDETSARERAVPQRREVLRRLSGLHRVTEAENNQQVCHSEQGFRGSVEPVDVCEGDSVGRLRDDPCGDRSKHEEEEELEPEERGLGDGVFALVLEEEEEAQVRQERGLEELACEVPTLVRKRHMQSRARISKRLPRRHSRLQSLRSLRSDHPQPAALALSPERHHLACPPPHACEDALRARRRETHDARRSEGGGGGGEEREDAGKGERCARHAGREHGRLRPSTDRGRGRARKGCG